VPINSLNAKTLAYFVYLKLILSFSNVICLFVNDLGRTEVVTKMLASWLISLSSCSLDLLVSTYSCVLILKKYKQSSFNKEKAIIYFIKNLAKVTKLKNKGLRQKLSRRLTEARLIALLK
jgi:predicted membrane-bound spermidine synthase